MPALVHQRCAHHALREAVARCLECDRFFCRECITEHDERVLCSSCLKKLTVHHTDNRARWRGLARVVQIALGLLICWTFFYWLGRTLLSVPSSFHEGTIWQKSFWSDTE